MVSNVASRPKKGGIGVRRRHGDGMWEARAIVDRKSIHVGTYNLKKEAALARDLYVWENSPSRERHAYNNPEKVLKKADWPNAIGTEDRGGGRKPGSSTGYKYIHQNHNKFVLRRRTKDGDGTWETFRSTYDTIDHALKARKKLFGIPVDQPG